MSVVALVIAPSIAMDLDGQSSSNSSDNTVMLADVTKAKGMTGLISGDEKTEFISYAKYVFNGVNIKSISVSLDKNTNLNNLSTSNKYISAENLSFKSDAIELTKNNELFVEYFAKGILRNGIESTPATLNFFINNDDSFNGEIVIR